MADKKKKDADQPEELTDEQLDEAAGGLARRATKLTSEELSKEATTDTTTTSRLRR